MKRPVCISALIGLMFILNAMAFAEGAALSDVEIFEAEQTVRAMHDSKLVYGISITQNGEVPAVKRPGTILSGWVSYVTDKKGSISVSALDLKGEASDLFDEAEKVFFEGRFAEARKMYMKINKMAPEFLPIYNYIGDTYYSEKDYENALLYFKKEVQVNYVNYQGHWFLADALWHLGRVDEAANEITTAHILNRNKKEIMPSLKAYRKGAGKPWKDWEYIPEYSISKKDDGSVEIKAPERWMGYAMAKAMWKYEPDYAKKHGLGPDLLRSVGTYVSEADAFLGMASVLPKDDMLYKISEGEDLMPFIWYEAISPDDPSQILLRNRSIVNAIRTYLDKYHTEPL